MGFAVNDRVAWSHKIGPNHDEDSIIKASAVVALDRDALFGTITKADEATPNIYEVTFDAGQPVRVGLNEGETLRARLANGNETMPADQTATLTGDELVKVKGAIEPEKVKE